jgi:hypothetical protein
MLEFSYNDPWLRDSCFNEWIGVLPEGDYSSYIGKLWGKGNC